MKLATWNVNGIRARQTDVQAFIEREQPDVFCLQELKASLDQLPVWLCELEGYWCYWHGGKGYSGVGLHVRKAAYAERPRSSSRDHEHRSRASGAGDRRVDLRPNGKIFPPRGSLRRPTPTPRVQVAGCCSSCVRI
jgi:exonuclease III